MEILKNPMEFVKRWYHEGVLCAPPPCLYSPSFRAVCSESKACKFVGKCGLKWGAKYRSQLMFFAFWSSFASIILLISPFVSLSLRADQVKQNAWTVGDISFSEADYKLYVGLRYVKVACEGSECDPAATSFSWSAADCNASYCESCRNAADNTIITAFTGLITMLPQISTNIQRSKPEGDLHCQKIMGMFTSLAGALSTFGAIFSYSSGCYVNLPHELYGDSSIHWSLGRAFFCCLVASILKILDLLINAIVPVPEHGYWKDEDVDDTVKEVSLVEVDTSTAKSSSKISPDSEAELPAADSTGTTPGSTRSARRTAPEVEGEGQEETQSNSAPEDDLEMHSMNSTHSPPPVK